MARRRHSAACEDSPTEQAFSREVARSSVLAKASHPSAASGNVCPVTVNSQTSPGTRRELSKCSVRQQPGSGLMMIYLATVGYLALVATTVPLVGDGPMRGAIPPAWSRVIVASVEAVEAFALAGTICDRPTAQ